jgi:succinate dehydrogenase flavin-adding protein (antitoxin of CptAB toxin-antitoxin module)
MDRHLSWSQLSLNQQLNCVCDLLAKQAVTNAIIEGYNTDHTQLLPREDIALIVWGDKITGDNISGPLRFHASKAVARKYHINQWKRGKWTQEQFEEVDWEHLDLALKSKADNYKIWPSKQTSGFCDTRAQVGLYSGDKFPDKRCPNCGARETDAHLMRCLDKNRMQLLINTVEELEKWMEFDGKTDPELIYWIPKYLLMRDDKPFSQLGYMSEKMRSLAESQDRIGWRNFTEGYISTHFYDIQRFHLLKSSSYLNGLDWTKQFISKLLQLTHSQWIYRNISLHDKKQGYL